ncbi:MAG: ABC transporter permease [Phycisphaerales bacterium]
MRSENPRHISVLDRLLKDRRAIVGLSILCIVFATCVGTMWFTFGSSGVGTDAAIARYNTGEASNGRAAPAWSLFGLLGTDELGRSLLYRCLAGGGISLSIGLLATAVSVGIGTIYGAAAGYLGGKIDALLMRIVDVLYGLPYVLLVVLLAVASDAVKDEYVTRAQERAALVVEFAREERPQLIASSKKDVEAALSADSKFRSTLEDRALFVKPPREISPTIRTLLDLSTLLIAIAGVSWLTTARVIRGQVLSLKAMPFVEAAAALGASRTRIFLRHLLPNLLAPVIVYATLTVPQAILQESFLSFLGIGVKPPMPSWGGLAARGVEELNPYRSDWWLLAFPCGLLAITLLALNFVGEALREAADPKSRSRG